MSMSDQLHALLSTKNNVNDDAIKIVEQAGCHTIEDFANWVGDKSEIGETFFGGLEMKKNLQQVARVRNAWRQADLEISRGMKRKAEGLDDGDIDDPLPEEIFKDIVTKFQKSYDWPDFDSRRVGDDRLHGRFRRQFEKRQPSAFAIMKTRSLAKGQLEVASKNTRLAEGVLVQTRVPDQERPGQPTLAKFFNAFDIVINTWAMVAKFEVLHENKKMKYMHWAEGTAYLYEFQSRSLALREKYSERSVLQYLQKVEEDMRAKAIELARGSEQVPWGKALKTALKDENNLFTDHKDLLSGDRNWTSGGLFERSVQAKKRNNNKGSSSGQQGICKFFNAGNCRRDRCDFKHACSVILDSGKMCGRTDHGAFKHYSVVKKKGGGPKGRGKGKK